MKAKLVWLTYFLTLFATSSLTFSAELLIEAESFEFQSDIDGLDYTGNVILYGDGRYDKTDRYDTGWVLDQQFMDQMGSPYLLAHGLGHPVSDAVKTVNFPAKGKYRVWVRTFDWVGRWRNEPAPKRPRGDAPGRFEVMVNGKALKPADRGFAPEKTAFGASGTDWHWQDGGTIDIKKPAGVEIRIHDLTGFEGRCDAVFFTTDMKFRPPNADPAMKKWRQRLLDTQVPSEEGHYDMVVVGGGVSGMCAAIKSSRLGLKTALIQDRPVPGGNNSSEIRVHLLGSIKHEPYPHVGDIVQEVVQLADRHHGPTNTADVYADDQNTALLKKESNLSLYFSCRVNEVQMDGGRIAGLIAEHVQTGKRLHFTADLFADSTGDACLGYLAGADYDMQLYDGSNLESVHMGRCNNWNVIKTESSKQFTECPWAFDLSGNPILFENNPEKLGGWHYESGFKRHPIDEGERIRDGNFRAMYGVWDTLKNKRGLYPNYELNWAAYVSGKRESRRLMGDHVLTKDDIVNGVVYPDGCVPITRDIDLHYPREKENAGFEGDEFVAYCVFDKYKGPYWIPYRCFYSRNVENLFMAGRDASFTHEALGAPRVMRTCGMMGEIVGMAASVCKKHDTTPRGVYSEHLDKLFALMKASGSGSVNGKKVYDARIKGKEILTPKAGPAPQINGPDIYGGRPNKEFIYRIPTTGTRPMQFAVENLPATLKLNEENGIISGRTPAEKGEYVVTLRAKNAQGENSKQFTLVVGDTLALTPTMGWNHWYTHYHFVTDEIIRSAAEAMVKSGMADLGYQYVSIDDCWMRITPENARILMETGKHKGKGMDVEAKVGPVRDNVGKILPARDFPDMKALADTIHSYGLRAGIYTSPGEWTCQRFEGAYGYEFIDAQTFAEWGFDLLKYDWCSYGRIAKVTKGDPLENRPIPYKLMGGILEQQNRDIVLNICEYGHDVWKWGMAAGGHSWRTGGDLGHTLTEGGIYAIAEKTINLREYNGPGGWNDPDYLILGNWTHPFVRSALVPVDLTANEQYSYFSLWTLMACPLFFSGDMATLDEFTYGILCNPEMIAVNQDRLGLCAEPVRMSEQEWVLKKELADGSIAIGFFDISGAADREIQVTWSELGLSGPQTGRDLWRQKNIGNLEDDLAVRVGPYGCAVIRLQAE